MKKSFLSGYAVPEWLADACARECARGFAVMLYFLSVNWNFFLRLHRARQK